MSHTWQLLAIATVWMLAGAVRADPPAPGLPPGAYLVEVRLRIPNVNAWSWSATKRVCIADRLAAGELPVPVLGPNNPFGDCRAAHIERNGRQLTYDIACAGRDAGRARAVYRLLDDGFSGEIAMVLGAKNMTVRELQAGRRLGSCEPADGPAG